MTNDEPTSEEPAKGKPFRRRQRYRGTHPRNFNEKYKELSSSPDPETIAKLIGAGKTPAGQHRPILVTEILEFLAPQPGERGADVTFGLGGHSERLLTGLQPGGPSSSHSTSMPCNSLLLRSDCEGLASERKPSSSAVVTSLDSRACCHRSVGTKVWTLCLRISDCPQCRLITRLVDSLTSTTGPLDMRMNPKRGLSARDWLKRCPFDKLVRVLIDGGDEPRAEQLAAVLVEFCAREPINTTGQLRLAIESALPNDITDAERRSTLARVFQAIRIAVNDEFSALDTFLRRLPDCLLPGGRVAILSFHSGEDRRVKHHFRSGFRSGVYCEIAPDVIRPTGQEIRANSRSASAKMRWAIRS